MIVRAVKSPYPKVAWMNCGLFSYGIINTREICQCSSL